MSSALGATISHVDSSTETRFRAAKDTDGEKGGTGAPLVGKAQQFRSPDKTETAPLGNLPPHELFGPPIKTKYNLQATFRAIEPIELEAHF